MIYFKSGFGADIFSVPVMPTYIPSLNYIELKNGMFDELYFTANTNEPYELDPTHDWDENTMFLADFNGDALAGNFHFDGNNVYALLVKRRKYKDWRWITLYSREIDHSSPQSVIESIETKIDENDYTCQIGTSYQYAVVPVLADGFTEGDYFETSGFVDIKSDTMVIVGNTNAPVLSSSIDKDDITDFDTNSQYLVNENYIAVYSTVCTDGFYNSTAIVPSSTIETMHDKYPTIIRNTVANYEQIDFTGIFLPDFCYYMSIGKDMLPKDMIDYSRNVYNFLRDGRSKLIKTEDGRMWLIYITTPPTDSAKDIYYIREISFTGTEVGNPESEIALGAAGLISSDPQWWTT